MPRTRNDEWVFIDNPDEGPSLSARTAWAYARKCRAAGVPVPTRQEWELIYARYLAEQPETPNQDQPTAA